MQNTPSPFTNGDILLQNLLDASVDGILAFDCEIRYTAWNRAMERISGVAADQALGRVAFEVFPFLVETGEDAYFHAALEGRTVRSEDRPFDVPGTGRSGFFSAAYSPLRNRNGAIIGGLALIRDVTERRQSESALNESEERQRLILDNALDAVITIDDGDRITDWNRGAESVFGWSTAEVIGRRLVDSVIPSQHRAAHIEGLRRYLETGEGPVLNRRIEITALHRDGREIPVELAITPVRTAGKIQFSAFVRDISERKQAEEALKRSEQRFRAVFEHAGVGIALVGLDGAAVSVNPALGRMLGYSPEELCGQSVADITHPEDWTLDHSLFNELLSGRRQHYQIEKRYIHRDGNIVWGQLTASLVRDERGDPIHGIGLVEDVTDRKRAESERHELLARESEARRQAEQARERMAFLAKASKLFAESLSYEDTLQSVARVAVPDLADWCAVDVLESGGRTRRVALAHTDAGRESWSKEMHERYPPDPEGRHPVMQVLREGKPLLVSRVTDEHLAAAARTKEHLESLRSLGIRSGMVVPMSSHGRVIGAISLLSSREDRIYSEDDLSFATDLAHRAALAVEAARLYRAEQERSEQLVHAIHEVHHRVKNNLQAVTALLQMRAIEVGEKQVVEDLETPLRQIKAIALVHDLLTRDSPMGTVDAATMLARLIELLRIGLTKRGRPLNVILESQNVRLPTREAISLVLAANELITNAVKHGHIGEDTDHDVRVQLSKTNDLITLRVEDRGAGFAPGFDPLTQEGIGLELVHTLVTTDLHGDLTFSTRPDSGGTVAVQFLQPRVE